MTCQTFREMLKKHPWEFTTAERTAHLRHSEKCQICLELIPRNPMGLSDEDKARIADLVEKDQQDPEGL